MVSSRPAVYRRCGACDVADRRRRHQPRDSGRGRRREYTRAAAPRWPAQRRPPARGAAASRVAHPRHTMAAGPDPESDHRASAWRSTATDSSAASAIDRALSTIAPDSRPSCGYRRPPRTRANALGLDVTFGVCVADSGKLSNDELLDRLQRAAFGYFLTAFNPANGLVADTTRNGSPSSIAVVGFALSAYPVGVERGWMTREDAAARTLLTLRFFSNSVQSDAPDATGYRGFYYHFLDMHSGQRVWHSEVSLIDTTLLLAGVLTAGAYFTGATTAEAEIRELADALYRRVDWDWARNGKATVSHGWKPECQFLHYGWEGYNEATILYVLGLASPTRPLPAQSYAAWTSTYQWENV